MLRLTLYSASDPVHPDAVLEALVDVAHTLLAAVLEAETTTEEAIVVLARR